MAYVIPDPRFEMPDLFEPGRKPVGNVEYIGLYKKDLIACAPINGNFDLVSETHGINTDTIYQANRLIGSGVNGDYTEYANYNTPTYPFTVVVDAKIKNINTYFSRIFSLSYDAAAAYYGINLYTRTSSPRILLRVGDGAGTGSTNRRDFQFDPPLTENSNFKLVIKIDSNSGGQLWFNGVAYALDAISGTYTGEPIGGTNNGLYVAGGINTSTDIRGCAGDVFNVQIFNNGLPDSLCKDLSINPYQFLVPA